MARVANVDIAYVDKIISFLKYLIEVECFKETSIARAIGNINTKSVRKFSLNKEKCFKLTIVYHNNYIKWCNNNGYEVEESFRDYIKKIY